MRRTATFVLAALALLAGTTVSGSSPLARLRAHTSPVAAPASPAAMMVGSDACNGQDYGTAGQFDFYVFAQSWPAEFCQAKPSWPGCQSPTQWQRTKLTLHGMWPNYNSKQSGHGWPQCCQSPAGSDLDPSVVRALLSDLQTYWPNEQDPSGNNLAKSLWAHEWNKHGTCSGLDQKSYFQQAMEMERSMPTPSVITQNVGSSVSLSDLKSAYNAGNCLIGGSCMTGFNCDVVNGQQYLSGITTCWDTNFNQIQCGPATLGSQGQQCTASTINIRSF